MIPPGCSRGLLEMCSFFSFKNLQYNTCTATASVSSTKCSDCEWSCTILQFSCTQAYVILLQQGQFALRSITSSDVHEQDRQRHPVDPYHTLLKVLTIHTYLEHEGRNKLPVSRTPYYCFPVQQTTRSGIGHRRRECRILRSHTHRPSRRAEGIHVRTQDRPTPA